MIKNIIFDFGGVLMDWDPRYFYKNYFQNDEKMEYFLQNIATSQWNEEQDAGRTLEDGTQILIDQFPDWEKQIRAFYDNWSVMLKGEIEENVEILRKLSTTQYELFGLTNWSSETFPYALEHYSFFEIFNNKIVVSGIEKIKKPDPKIWHILLQRYNLVAKESVFIDDNPKNIEVAGQLGFKTIKINPDSDLKAELSTFGINI
ncbi:HAD family hydrolase [Chryseobacterium sp.]|uniref:HAD family hydrolase n=1 Tax=Chryseobacterium sp. TaxID=1871047 RepID=UPI00388F07FA